ncbi:RICIN domain-containing protein [Streptomyces cyaneofuscatus]|uniref:RICIN domain-containing protein n=1 Tax=Streptomyces cyaneofuscatus TaxID=66883 RepID=UPI0036BCB39D
MDKGNGYVSLETQHSGRCLDVSGLSTADGARLFQYTCGSGGNQQCKRPGCDHLAGPTVVGPAPVSHRAAWPDHVCLHPHSQARGR